MKIKYTAKKLQDSIQSLLISRKISNHDNWSREYLEEFQNKQLSNLVRYAIDHSPFYKVLYEHINTDEEIKLEMLPVINKRMLMENFDQIVTDPRLNLANLNSYIAHAKEDDYYLGEYRVLTTGGSSGFKGVFVYDRKEWCQTQARVLRSTQYMGISPCFPRLKVASIGAGKILHASYRLACSTDIGLYNIKRYEATDRIDEMVQSLNKFQPDYLSIYPSMAALLAIEQIEGRLHIHPKVVSTGCEVCTPEMKQRMLDAWAIKPFDSYGFTELILSGSDCSFREGVHIFEDFCFFEVVDEHNRPVPDGCMGHKILITNLFSFTQPIIRYEITDMIIVKKELCSCGSPFRLISSINGRSDDIINLPGKYNSQVPVHPLLFWDSIEIISEITQFQVIHTEGLISVRLMIRDGFDEKKIAYQLEQRLKSGLESLGALLPSIQIEFVKAIKREPSQMRKLKVIQSNVKRVD